MEFMVIAVAFIAVVLGLYLFIEQSLLRRYNVIESVEDAQEYFDAWNTFLEQLDYDDEFEDEPTIFERIANRVTALRW